jgi:phospholipase/carboxylesterase
MNRLQNCAPVHELIPEPQLEVEQGRVHSSQCPGVSHSLFAPLHYEPNYAYPLIVWLHGPGDNEGQLSRVMPLISMRNYVAVAPRGTVQKKVPESHQSTYHWSEDPHHIQQAEERIFDCIEIAQQKYHIEKVRVFLAGFREGGTMSFRLGLKHPDQFAGVISIGGPFPTGQNPLFNLDQARQLPLLISHGSESECYPVDRVCSDLRLFHSGGMKVTVRQYPCGDEITTKMLSDIDAWVMELVTGVHPTPHQQSCFRLDELN